MSSIPGPASSGWRPRTTLAPPTNDYVVLDCKCIEIDRWMHWTAVFDSTNRRFSLYHGARFSPTAPPSPRPSCPASPISTLVAGLKAGRSISGVIDDYAIWSRALSADEVAAIDAQSRARPALTLRAIAGAKKLGLLFRADGSSSTWAASA